MSYFATRAKMPAEDDMSYFATRAKMPAEDRTDINKESPIMDGPTDREIAEAHKRAEAVACKCAPAPRPERGRRICEEALRTINGERQDAYGNPEDTFFRIACLWSSYLGREVEGSDVANMMILLKIAREKEGKGKRDNFVDILGYAALGASMRGYDA